VKKTLANDETDPLGRVYYGWDKNDPIKENWERNRGYYALGERADRQTYVAFSFEGKLVMVAKIKRIVPAKGRPGKRIIEGKILGPGEPIWDTYVGHPTPSRALGVRNTVTYVDEAEQFGKKCACGCGEIVFESDFVRVHDQTALHQRVARIGTIKEFLRWFDAVEADTTPQCTRTTFSRNGRLDFREDGGTVTLTFTSAAPLDD
jgi:hypothetical protein